MSELTAKQRRRAARYNARRLEHGRIELADISEIVAQFQAANGLKPDGKIGPLTLSHVRDLLHKVPQLANHPLRLLPDGREPHVTSRHKAANPSRLNHDGDDYFYPYRDSDPDVMRIARVMRDGERRWFVPCGTLAIAADDGVVGIAGPWPTGDRVWVNHGQHGIRTGYFHLRPGSLLVSRGDQVAAGQPLGIVSDNPRDPGDKWHLHFEVSPLGIYAPVDPAPYLVEAVYLPAAA